MNWKLQSCLQNADPPSSLEAGWEPSRRWPPDRNTARSLKQLGDYDEKEETHGKRKSNSVLPGAKKKLKVADNLTSEMHFVLQTRWLAATTVGDDVLNYITIEFVELQLTRHDPVSV